MRSLIPLIKPLSILALTATAGPMVVRDICNTLCIPFDGLNTGVKESQLPLGSEKQIENKASNTSNRRDGVRVLNCDRDNIDVFSLVLQSNDERRYLVSSKIM